MKEQVFEILKSVVGELNEELDYETLNTVNDETPLFGSDDGIDSISLARLVSDVELEISSEMGKKVILADEKALSMRNSPYRNVGTLMNFIMERLEFAHG